jgi:hypothetical protein
MSELIPIRLSHLLRHCAVGAVVRGPNYLLTVMDIREWTDKSGNITGRPIRYVERVRAALGVERELREPPLAREVDPGRTEGVCVPAIRFPAWMRCPNPQCGFLYYQPWRQIEGERKPRCPQCERSPELEQAPWLLAHPAGYMAEVPWHLLAHLEAKAPSQKQCRENWQGPAYLRLWEKGGKGRLRCKTCQAETDFREGTKIPFKNYRRQPWLRSSPGPPPADDALAEVIGVNDVRVHFPVTQNALVIPPESRIRRGTVVDRLYCSSEKRREIDQARTDLARQSKIKSLASVWRCTGAEIEQALREIDEGYPLHGATFTKGQLLESEHQALTSEIPDVADNEDFVPRHHTGAWKSLGKELSAGSDAARVVKLISRLVAVTRLREIQVFKGFQRIDPNKGFLVPPDLEGKSSWLPAIEMYGEGIFMSLDEAILQRWEEHWTQPPGAERFEAIKTRFTRADLPFEPPIRVTPRFLLLHTLAHILIRHLEAEAGYPAASLKERIYSDGGQETMAGVLIYVAVPDVLGSLGGLAELAAPRRFLPLLTGVFQRARWCSLDPVCSEHEGQGPQLLNRAACHACVLIPEPSCAYNNVLLDRTFIKGDISGKIPGILDTV